MTIDLFWIVFRTNLFRRAKQPAWSSPPFSIVASCDAAIDVVNRAPSEMTMRNRPEPAPV